MVFRILSIAALLLSPQESRKSPLVRTADLALGEEQTVELCDGRTARVKLVDLQETRDDLRQAVRRAQVKLEVNGTPVTLASATYHLPVTVAGVQIDCPITKGFVTNSRSDPWGLVKDARVRLWPAGSPLQVPGTFVYPLKQRWFASDTQMANEPTFVDGGEVPGTPQVYYHYGLDFGGSEGLVEVVAATDGLVVSSGKDRLPGHEKTPVAPRYDVIYILDGQGWYYRYSHLKTIDVKLGDQVKMGQRMGLLGKEGGSGGWSHLHFDINAMQPSGKWGIQEGYAFVWEAYQRQHAPKLVAVARPHHFAAVGQKVTLDASRSWGKIVKYEWISTDGTGATIERTYAQPGSYSEILKVTDVDARVDYDFADVQIVDPARPKELPPTIHPNYSPTFGIKPGDPVTFKVRTFRTTDGEETWDFGDGTAPVKVKSDGNVKQHAPDGYAETVHRFEKAGQYVVRVERSNRAGMKAVGHLHVRVGGEP